MGVAPITDRSLADRWAHIGHATGNSPQGNAGLLQDAGGAVGTAGSARPAGVPAELAAIGTDRQWRRCRRRWRI